jgi:UDP-2,3-diacylglucosamine hydrolase
MIIFCSDVHLHLHPDETPNFPKFLTQLPKTTRALFILGDLFEVWWGDDHHYTPYLAWEKIFSDLRIPIYFIAGNRDFLCGKDFFEKTGIIPLKSGCEIMFASKKINIYHGDEPFILQDKPYQAIRPWLRSPFLQSLFLMLPEQWRRKFSVKARLHSQPSACVKTRYDTSVAFNMPASIVIHGHLHFAKETHLADHSFYQLGCWDNQESSWLALSEEGVFEWHSF